MSRHLRSVPTQDVDDIVDELVGAEGVTLRCPTCGTGLVRQVAFKTVTCQHGHTYPEPDGNYRFHTEVPS